jgi:Zn-dependent peptidase ImmA (M78 family)
LANLVAPLTLSDIRNRTDSRRNLISIKNNQVFPVMEFIEIYDVLYIEDTGDTMFHLGTVKSMPYSVGETDIKTGLITLREDHYERACDGDKEGLFTAAHELGHHELHKGGPLHRLDLGSIIISDDYCPEIQADSYACELMIDSEYLKKNHKKIGLAAISEKFRVPLNKLSEHVIRMMEHGDIAAVQGELNLIQT